MSRITAPKKLAIYYGIPNQVNNTLGDINLAASIFANYDMIIFGIIDNSVNRLINHDLMKNTTIFGYIDSTSNNFKKNINLWQNVNVKGIFCDFFGFNSGISRAKQNSILNYIHSKKLIAMVSAPNLDDIFTHTFNKTYNPKKIPILINANDWFLCQSYQIVNGKYQDAAKWKNISDKLIKYRNTFGTKIACSTTYSDKLFDQQMADYSYYSCLLYNFDAWCWTEYLFSKFNNLPFRTRKPFHGIIYENTINNNNGIIERKARTKISIDTHAHVVKIV